MRQDTLQRADKDGDGKLSVSEMTTALREFKDREKQRRRLWTAVKAAFVIIVVQARLPDVPPSVAFVARSSFFSFL